LTEGEGEEDHEALHDWPRVVEYTPPATWLPEVIPYTVPLENGLQGVRLHRLTADQKRYLAGPVVMYNRSWGENLPAWMEEAILPARLRQVIAEVTGEEPEGLASLEEVTAYLYTACLAMPLSREYARVYFWVVSQVLLRYGMISNPESLAEQLGIRPEELCLSNYERSKYLDRLRRDIRRGVVRNAKKKTKKKRS
jgi:hypothetical protein